MATKHCCGSCRIAGENRPMEMPVTTVRVIDSNARSDLLTHGTFELIYKK